MVKYQFVRSIKLIEEHSLWQGVEENSITKYIGASCSFGLAKIDALDLKIKT